MSFSLSNISGSQIQKDSFINNLTVACDPGLVAPKNLNGLPNPLNLEKRDGKAAIGVDICDLDVSNLTVNGNLVVKGPAEICDIVCPVDFNVTAGNNINETAAANMNLTATGVGAGDGSINLNSSANATGTGGQIVLNANATTNNFDSSGVEVNGQNIRSVAAQAALTSGGALNVFPRVPGAKGLSVVCKDTIQGEFGIAADLTGTTILRADGTALNTGATGHLMSAPSGVNFLGVNAVDVTLTPGNNVIAVGVLGNCSDTCGTVIVEPAANSIATQLTVEFAKRFPTPFVNVQITAADRFGASCTDVWTGSVAVGSEATAFNLNFVSGAATAGQECLFHYFVMDVVGVSQQHG